MFSFTGQKIKKHTYNPNNSQLKARNSTFAILTGGEVGH